MPHRCIFGCPETDTVLHVFPNPKKIPDRFKAWVNLAGGRLVTPSDYDFYKKKRVCDIHFTEEHRNRFKRLNALAIPSLHLPGTSVPQQFVEIHAKASTGSPIITLSESDQPVPEDFGPVMSNIRPIITTAQSNLSIECPDASVYGLHALSDHNYSCCSRTRPKRVTVYNSQLWLHQKIRNFRSEICRLRKSNMTFKKRLETVEKLSENFILYP